MYKLLILEDDSVLLETLQDELTGIGLSVTTSKHEEDALKLIYENSYDLYLFDINVPYINGLHLLKELRDANDTTPAIFLTSKNTLDDKIVGFESGCDDYVTKPFSMVELQYRIKTILKRFKHESIFEQDNILIDLKNNLLTIDNQEIEVDRKVVEILHLFITNPNRIFSYEDIIDKLYTTKIPSHTVIRVHISKINSLFETKPIKNIRGFGYKYENS